ncbi:hypothetical protein ERUR111494_04570 [Erysipelothrix urinaevulpis]|uniref:hypothetical protein n=1 Tax=Erysipelothrix urinaevulpis TaxID=2683717 RepID=UPI0013580FAF|nr:hypothetical protein [Erysipelothrix urinaevulpis]
MKKTERKIRRQKNIQRSESGFQPKNTFVFYFGIVIYLFGFIMWFIETENNYRYSNFQFVLAFIIMVIGLIIVYIGTKRNILSKNYREYYDIIYQNEMFTTEEIASHVGKENKIVIKEIQMLIKLGYFKNIRVNETDNTITGAFVNSIKEMINRKMIRCGGCGASNEVIEHMTTECEYCGRKLSYQHH